MTQLAAGTFEVSLEPQSPDSDPQGVHLSRAMINKTFSGDLQGKSRGQMLSIMSDVKDSGAYVALEFVTGSLLGRQGSFAMHHTGRMERGAPSLHISVVPDSGTDELAGLSGDFEIIIADGQHSYKFNYVLPGDPL